MIDDDLIREWHRVMGVPVADHPTLIPVERSTLREDLIREELNELEVAIAMNDLIEIADALGDLLYVTIGAAVEYGIPIADVFAEIHHSNMTKLGPDNRPIRRDDGKILKGPDYRPPDIGGVLGL